MCEMTTGRGFLRPATSWGRRGEYSCSQRHSALAQFSARSWWHCDVWYCRCTAKRHGIHKMLCPVGHHMWWSCPARSTGSVHHGASDVMFSCKKVNVPWIVAGVVGRGRGRAPTCSAQPLCPHHCSHPVLCHVRKIALSCSDEGSRLVRHQGPVVAICNTLAVLPSLPELLMAKAQEPHRWRSDTAFTTVIIWGHAIDHQAL